MPERAADERSTLAHTVELRFGAGRQAGLFVARGEMAGWLRIVSDALPLTYAYEALARIVHGGPYSGRFVLDVGVTIGATLVALGLAAVTLRRRTD